MAVSVYFRVRVTVTNTGNRAGRQVVQLYASQADRLIYWNIRVNTLTAPQC